MDMDKTVNSDENKKSFSKPSEPSNSFVKKVTTRVSELLPSTFSKWLSPGSSATVRRRESESDDDEDNFNSIQPPPLKRQRLPEEIDIGPSCSKAFTDDSHIYRDGQVAGPSGLRNIQSRLMSSTPIGRQIRSQSVNLYDNKSMHSKHLNGDIKNDNSESTSGCSSMAQMVISKLEDSDTPKTANTSFSSKMNKEKDIIEEISKKELNRSRSLFMEHNLSPRLQTSQSRRPSFNASSFGSPGLIDRTLTSERIARSPFYRGRTMFGGAASAGNKKRRTGVSPHNVSIPIRNSVEIKPTNETSDNSTVGMSQTARRILDALQSFSTPVSDAKKIPKPNLSHRRELENKSIRLSAPSTPYSRERTPRSQTKAVSGIVIPTVPDIMQIRQKERIQNSTVQVRQLATTSTSSLNAETEYKIRTVDDDSKAVKHTNKMKSRVSRKDTQDTETETAEVVKLPNVTLPPLTTLPIFDQPVLAPPPVATSVNIVPTVTFAPITAISTAPSCSVTAPTLATTKAVSSQSNNYKFSAPIILNKTVTKSIMSINNFKFSTPLKVDNTSKISSSPTSANMPLINFNAPSLTGTVLKKKIITNKNNGENIDFLNFTPPKELKRNSVMDVLGKKPEQETKSDDVFEKFKPAPGTWECDSCLIRNKPQDVRCVACEAPRQSAAASTTTNATGFGLQFKMPADKWECTVCLVRNDSGEQKCVACTTPRAKTKSDTNAKTNFSTSVSGFGDKFKPSSDTWECSTCLVRNKADKDKCVACETAKPGSVKKSSSNQTSTSGSSQSVEKSSKKWECSVCMVWNTADKSKCVCCAASKPGSNNLLTSYSPGKSNAPTFKFGIDKATEKVSENKPTQPNTGFVFGASPAGTKTEKTNADEFVFGKQTTDTEKSENKVDSKPVSGFVFGKPTTETKTDNFSFGIKPLTNSSSGADSKPTFSFGIPPKTNDIEVNQKFTVSDTPTKPLVEKNVKPSKSLTEKSEPTITNLNPSTNSVNNLTSLVSPPELMFKFTPTTTINENISKPSAPTTATSANLFSFGAPKTTIANFSTTPATVNMTTAVSTSPLFGTNNASTMGKLSFGAMTKPASVDNEHEPSAKKPLITNMFPTNALAVNSSKDTLDSSAKYTNLKSTAPNMAVPSFNFSTKVDMSTFGTASKLEGMPAFGSIPINQPQNSNPSFIQTQEGFSFGAPKNEAKPTSLFMFGANKTGGTEQNKSSGFSFPAKPVSTAPPAYNFGNSLNSCTNQNTGFSFGSTQSTEKFNFNASKPETTPFGINAQTELPFGAKKKETTAFGAPPSNTTSLFRTNEQATVKPSFSAATNAPNANFNFGSTSNTQQNTPFSFGNNQSNKPAASSTSGGFSFGQPSTFDPNTKPSFNFSGGAGVPSFTAQPSPGPAAPQRRIKKALRRTAQPR